MINTFGLGFAKVLAKFFWQNMHVLVRHDNGWHYRLLKERLNYDY